MKRFHETSPTPTERQDESEKWDYGRCRLRRKHCLSVWLGRLLEDNSSISQERGFLGREGGRTVETALPCLVLTVI